MLLGNAAQREAQIAAAQAELAQVLALGEPDAAPAAPAAKPTAAKPGRKARK